MKKILSLLFVFSMVVAFAGVSAPTTASAVAQDKVNICHRDGNSGNWNTLNVDANGWNGHSGHPSDYLYAGPVDDNGKATDDTWCANHIPDNGPTTATITLVKHLDNTGGGTAQNTDWTLSATMGQTVVSGVTGDASITNAVINPGSYTLAESTGPANYQAGAWSCTDNGDAVSQVSPISISAGDVVNCSITNTFVPPVPPEETSCIASTPNTEGDKVVPANPGDGNPLQSIFDTTYGANVINAATAETGIQSWNVTGKDSVTFSGKFLAAYAGNQQEFGYYFDGDISTYTPIFRQAGHSGSEQVLAIGDTIPSFTITTTGHTTIGFALDTAPTSPARYGTEKSVNANNEDHAAIYVDPTNTKAYIIGFEDLPFATADKDYNDLVVDISVDDCSTGGNQCVPSSGTVSSDTTTQVTYINPADNNDPATPYNALVVTPTAITTQYWTTLIPGASWIWSESGVSNWTADKTVTFTKTFNVTGTPTSGSLKIAADNTYTVKVNNTVVEASGVDGTFGSGAVTYDISSALVTGTNTITITVTNKGQSGDAVNNPGGLLYSLTWNSDCTPPPPTECTKGHVSNGDGGCVCPQGQDENSDGFCEPIVTPPTTVKVTIDKFIEGEQATANTANNESFPMTATWNAINLGAGSGGYALGITGFNSPNPYEAVTADMSSGADYSTAEVTSDNNVVGPNCNSGTEFSLVGYSTGDTLAAAENATQSLTAPSFTDLTSDKFVIVWNHKCPTIVTDSSADLSVTKTVDDNTPDIAQQITYTVTVHNAGPDSATGVTVTDMLPPLTTWVSDDSSGAYNTTTHIWTIGTIASGADAVLHVTVSINSGSQGATIINTADINHSDVTDPNPDNNSSTASIKVNTPGGPTEETDVCPNIDGVQTSVPAGKHINSQGNCVGNGSSSSSGGSIVGGGSSGGQVLGAETSVCNWDIKTYMRKGYKNDVAQVKILQNDLLNGYMHLGIPVDGIYGSKTEAGVKAFQLAHADKILKPWNLTVPTGIFYKTTLVEAKNTICPAQILPIPTDLIPWNLNSSQVPAPVL